MEIERFEDYAIAVTQPHTHKLQFEVKRIIGVAINPPPAGVWLYRTDDGWTGTTTEFDKGEPLLDGDIKWDGCSDWDFHSEPVMVHFCSRNEAAGIGRLLDHLYQITKERLEPYEGD